MTTRAFDLFCGAGGSSAGAQLAGVKVVGGIDLWDKAAETFQLNFPDAVVYNRPIHRLAACAVAREVGPIDLLLASPECTNHSVAKGAAPRCEDSRRTAFEVIRFAKAWRPRWVVVENVVSMQRWDSYGEWLRRLRDLRYHVKQVKLNSEHFSVPQCRRRLFVLADLQREPEIPQTPSNKKIPIQQVLRHDSASEGYSYKLSPLFAAKRAKPTLERARRAIRALGSDQSFLIVYYGSDAAGGWQRVDRPLRTITTLDRFALVQKNGNGHVMRMLQPPELAAAMGFPGHYRWPKATRREHIKLIGNAVSPPVMTAVVDSLLAPAWTL